MLPLQTIAHESRSYVHRVTTTQDNEQLVHDIGVPSFPLRSKDAKTNIGYPQWHVEDPGNGNAHPVAPEEVLERLHQLPPAIAKQLRTCFDHLSMPQSRRKNTHPCYGMQWKSTIYLFPMEQSGVEEFWIHPTVAYRNELARFGAKWHWNEKAKEWTCHWTKEALRIFYLENVLLHEIGHLLDTRNTSTKDRERYANAFAMQYGRPPKSYHGKKPPHAQRKNRRHG